MFCIHCGKELDDRWIRCPYCGMEVKNLANTRGITGNKNENEEEVKENEVYKGDVSDEIPSSCKEYKLLGARRTGRFSFEYIPTYIQIDRDNVHVITQRNKSIESQFNKNEIENITLPILPIWKISDIICLIIFGVLMIFSYGLGIFAILLAVSMLVSRHVKIRLYTGQEIKIPICQKADASDFLRELNYPDEEIEKNNANKISASKWSSRERLRTWALLVIAMAALYFGLSLWANNNHKSEIKKDLPVKEVSINTYDMDFEKLIGISEEDIVNSDIAFDKDESEYKLYNGDVYVECIEGEVYIVDLKGDSKKAPCFHGIRIGMSMDEADALLTDTYIADGNLENKINYINLDSGVDVVLTVDNGSILEIFAMLLSEEELQEYKKEEEAEKKEKEAEKVSEEVEKKTEEEEQGYIFPDSDKKYLTEDEVLSVDVKKLRIARNEIFARHGYIFKSEDLKEYFENTSWYKGTVKADKFNSDKVFNDFEKKNVELIKRVEDEINGVADTKSFIGIKGEYQCGSDMEAGVISVKSIRNGIVYMDIGTHEYPYLLENIEGEIIDDHTVSYRGMTFVWTDVASLYVIDVPAGFSDVIWEGLDYLIADYYHVS